MRSRSAAGMPSPSSATSIAIESPSAVGRHGDLSPGRRVPDRVADQVVERLSQPLGVAIDDEASLGPGDDAAGARERRRLGRIPREAAGIEPLDPQRGRSAPRRGAFRYWPALPRRAQGAAPGACRRRRDTRPRWRRARRQGSGSHAPGRQDRSSRRSSRPFRDPLDSPGGRLGKHRVVARRPLLGEWASVRSRGVPERGERVAP